MILPPWLGHALNAPEPLILVSKFGGVGVVGVTGQLLVERWLSRRLEMLTWH